MKKWYFLLTCCLFLWLPAWAAPLKGNRFVVFTQPKTGTYLLTPILRAMTGRKQRNLVDICKNLWALTSQEDFNQLVGNRHVVPIYLHHEFVRKGCYHRFLRESFASGHFLFSHCPHSPTLEQLLKRENVVVFFIDRDPRDVICSGARFYGDGKQCPFPITWYQSLPYEQQIACMIRGTAWHNSARWLLKVFDGWRRSSSCCVVNYRKLVGPQGGGGKAEEQLRELRKISTALGLKFNNAELLAIFNACYGTGPTYKGASIGRWKSEFSENNKTLAKECLGDLLIEYGYEADYSW